MNWPGLGGRVVGVSSDWLKQTRWLDNDTGLLLEPKDEEVEQPQKETGPEHGQDPLPAAQSRQKMAAHSS